MTLRKHCRNFNFTNGHINLHNLDPETVYFVGYYINGKKVLIEIYPNTEAGPVLNTNVGRWQEDIVLRSNIFIVFKPGAVLIGSADKTVPAIVMDGSGIAGPCAIYDLMYTGLYTSGNKDNVLVVKSGGDEANSTYGLLFNSEIAAGFTYSALIVEHRAHFLAYYSIIISWNKDTEDPVIIFEGFAIDRQFESCTIGTELNWHHYPGYNPQISLELRGQGSTSGAALVLRNTYLQDDYSIIKIEDGANKKIMMMGSHIRGDMLNFSLGEEKPCPRTSLIGYVDQFMDAKPATWPQEVWARNFNQNYHPPTEWGTIKIPATNQRFLLYSGKSGNFTLRANLMQDNPSAAVAEIVADWPLGDGQDEGILLIDPISGTFHGASAIYDNVGTGVSALAVGQSQAEVCSQTYLNYNKDSGTFVYDETIYDENSIALGTLKAFWEDSGSQFMTIENPTRVIKDGETIAGAGGAIAEAVGDSKSLLDIPAFATGIMLQAYLKYAGTPDGDVYISLRKKGETDPSRQVDLYAQSAGKPITCQYPLAMNEGDEIEYHVNGFTPPTYEPDIEVRLTLLGWFFGSKE